MKNTKYNQEQFGLVEKSSCIVAGISTNLATINAVIEHSLGEYFIFPYINYRNGFELLDESPWECDINLEQGNISKHSFNIDTTYYDSLKKKILALEKISRDLLIQKNRYRLSNNDFTDLILLSKEMQAKNYIKGIEDNTCYIEEHAEALGMTLDQAAADIQIRSELMHRDFAKIEGMRLKYFKIILDSPIELIPTVLDRFRKECWFNI
jgi:hypothetical protein